MEQLPHEGHLAFSPILENTAARPEHLARLQGLLRRHPVVALLGARQAGKTTLVRQLAAGLPKVVVFDLENPTDLSRLTDPMLGLAGLSGLVVLDEVQRLPEIFQVLRVLADRPRRLARFLVLGSASPALLRQTSESLAGRVSFYELPGLSLAEVGEKRLERLWLRGGFPRSFVAASDAASAEWRRDFVATFLERDLPQLGIPIPAATLRRFWTMLAHYHGQVWAPAEFSRSFGVADTTVRRYLDLLSATFMTRVLPAWSENIRKRQVKAPKVYLADTGLLHNLLGLETPRDLAGHPKVGASGEGFALQAVIRRLGARREECFFWATHAGAELDLLVVRGRRRWGFEVKRTSSPGITRSMHSALADLRLQSLDVVHSGDQTYPLGPRVRALACAASCATSCRFGSEDAWRREARRALGSVRQWRYHGYP